MKKILTILLMTMLIMACIPFTVHAATVKLNKKTASITVGKTVQLKLLNNNKKVTWTSSNKKIATVSSKGLVKGIKKGTCKITAKVGSKKYLCTVTVNAKAAKLNSSNIKTTLKAEYEYTGKEIKPVFDVTYNGKKLTKGKNYKVEFKNNIEVGPATVIITGIESGGYTGKVTLTFDIIKKSEDPDKKDTEEDTQLDKKYFKTISFTDPKEVVELVFDGTGKIGIKFKEFDRGFYPLWEGSEFSFKVIIHRDIPPDYVDEWECYLKSGRASLSGWWAMLISAEITEGSGKIQYVSKDAVKYVKKEGNALPKATLLDGSSWSILCTEDDGDTLGLRD